LRIPPWIRTRFPAGPAVARVKAACDGLHTVCVEAGCPNRAECWESGHATFLILGSVCTRACRFCRVESGSPASPDPTEPRRVAEAAARLSLSHVVVTSVTRDDLPDGGASQFRDTVLAVRERLPESTVEVLVPDFGGNAKSVETVASARPEVFGHNLETVARLYPVARPGADYRRSLEVLKRASRCGLLAKTALILGLGETDEEVSGAMEDARGAGVSILHIGQYLQPEKGLLPVERYRTPEEFDALGRRAEGMGFVVASAPMVRSSRHAQLTYSKAVEARPPAHESF
jgi:lipoic acid synthetase